MTVRYKYLLLVLAAATLSLYQNCSPAQFDASTGIEQQLNCSTGDCGSGGNDGDPTPTPPPQKIPIATNQEFSFGPLSNKVDILMVVDDSQSMEGEQANLATHFTDFIGSLNGIDWQIAVTSTDVCPDNNIYPGETKVEQLCKDVPIANHARGRFLGPQGVTPHYSPNYIMTPSTPNVQDVFAKTIQRNGEQGTGDERAIFAANLVIDGKDDVTMSKNFFRDNSALAVVILSDEDERSVGGLQTATQYRKLEAYDMPDIFLTHVNSAFNGKKPVVVDAIAWKPNTACKNGAVQGKIYEMLVKLSGGVFGSICDNGSYTDDLQNISKNILDNINTKSIKLNHTPLDAPKVTFDPAANGVEYKWIAGTNEIQFTIRPPADTKVKVEYSYLPN